MRQATTTKDQTRALHFDTREQAVGVCQLVFGLFNYTGNPLYTDVRAVRSTVASDEWVVETQREQQDTVYLEDPEMND